MTTTSIATKPKIDQFDANTFMARAGLGVFGAIKRYMAEQQQEDEVQRRVHQDVLKQNETGVVIRLTVGETSFIVKAFDPSLPDSDWRLDREVNVLLALKGLSLVPTLIAYQETQKYLVMQDIKGQTLTEFLTPENLAHVSFRLGTWFRIMSERTPSQDKATNWSTYLGKYPDWITPEDMDKLGLFLSDIPITTFTINKNDAFMDNFLRTEDGYLIGIDFESTTLKPTGWDLLVTARTLGRKFPDRTAEIAAHLVGGWGPEIDGVPAEKFCELVQIFAKKTADRNSSSPTSPAQAFWETYKAAAAVRDDLPNVQAAFGVPFAPDTRVVATEAERAALYDSLLSSAVTALETPLPKDRATEPFKDIRVPSPLLKASCFACQGRCCSQGLDNHAFIKTPKLREVAARMPGASAEEIANYYMDKLPDTHVTGHCLFHSETGCALDRSERSNVCNEYLCRSGKAIENSFAEARYLQHPVLTVSVEDNEVKRAYVVSKDSIQKIDISE
jgi:hypothetical protein